MTKYTGNLEIGLHWFVFLMLWHFFLAFGLFRKGDIIFLFPRIFFRHEKEKQNVVSG